MNDFAPIFNEKNKNIPVNRFNGTEVFQKPANASDELSRIILKACAFDTSDRYASMDEMLYELESLASASDHPESAAADADLENTGAVPYYPEKAAADDNLNYPPLSDDIQISANTEEPMLPAVESKSAAEIKLVRAEIEAEMAAAERGDSEAQCKLGIRYENGNGVLKDLVSAAYWYKLAAEGGNVEAQWRYGRCCAKGKNTPEAMKWYRIAADRGSNEAKVLIAIQEGNLYRTVKAIDKTVPAGKRLDADVENIIAFAFLVTIRVTVGL